MQEETKNQETSPPPITSKPHQSIMQAKASFHIDGTGFGISIVSLSLDDDHHLRVYKQSDRANQALIPEEPILEIPATDVTRVYAMLSQILIKTTDRWHVFDLSSGAITAATMISSIDGAIGVSNAGALAYVFMMGPFLAKLHVDDWLDALQQEQFPVKKSRFNEFMVKKVYAHPFIAIMIGILLTIVLILIVSVIVMLATGALYL